jgi:anti-anti-sigma factor
MISTDGTLRHSPAAPPIGRTIVRLSDALDLAAAPALREYLIAVLHRGADPLVLDLSHVLSCDAAGLAVLIGTQRRARLLGVAMFLADPSLPVMRVLRLTGLYRSFTIYPDPSGALAPEHHEPAMPAPGPELPVAGRRRPFVPGARSA